MGILSGRLLCCSCMSAFLEIVTTEPSGSLTNKRSQKKWLLTIVWNKNCFFKKCQWGTCTQWGAPPNLYQNWIVCFHKYASRVHVKYVLYAETLTHGAWSGWYVWLKKWGESFHTKRMHNAGSMCNLFFTHDCTCINMWLMCLLSYEMLSQWVSELGSKQL